MNCSLVAVVVGLWALTLSLATAQPHSMPAPLPPTPPKVNFVDIAEHAGLTAKTEDGGEKTKRYIIETTGSGAAFLDYDNDGWPDIFVVNGSRLRDAIGARVTVRVGDHQQSQEVRSGGGYISQSDFRLHFGLGKATKADAIEIHWPSGLVQRLENISGNQIVKIRESIGIIKN